VPGEELASSNAEESAAAAYSESAGNLGRSHLRRHDWDYLELDQILPAGGPLGDEVRILALHQLEAAAKVMGHPACNVPESSRGESTLIAKSAIHGESVSVAKVLDDHEEHLLPCK
jgi:hypothetical protein